MKDNQHKSKVEEGAKMSAQPVKIVFFFLDVREVGKDVSVNPVFSKNTILTALNRVEVVNIIIFLRNTILTALSRVEVVNIVIL